MKEPTLGINHSVAASVLSKYYGVVFIVNAYRYFTLYYLRFEVRRLNSAYRANRPAMQTGGKS